MPDRDGGGDAFTVGQPAAEPTGHEVIVANARQVQLISKSSSKDDRMDARTLARLARFDPQLLRPIRHRSEEAQQDLMAIRVRAAAVDGSSQTGQRSAELGEVGG